MSAEENVIWLQGAQAATNGVPVERVLDSAKDECVEAVVIGYDKAGQLYAASSFAGDTGAKTLWILEQAKAWILAGCPAQDE